MTQRSTVKAKLMLWVQSTLRRLNYLNFLALLRCAVKVVSHSDFGSDSDLVIQLKMENSVQFITEIQLRLKSMIK